MRLKIVLLIIGVVMFLTFLFGVYFLSNFDLFEDEIILIEEIQIPNKNYSLKMYNIPSNATLESSIQIRKICNGKEEVLNNYTRYNTLVDYSLLEGDTLSLVLKDSLRAKSLELKIGLP